jgi:hypothetical protein
MCAYNSVCEGNVRARGGECHASNPKTKTSTKPAVKVRAQSGLRDCRRAGSIMVARWRRLWTARCRGAGIPRHFKCGQERGASPLKVPDEGQEEARQAQAASGRLWLIVARRAWGAWKCSSHRLSHPDLCQLKTASSIIIPSSLPSPRIKSFL